MRTQSASWKAASLLAAATLLLTVRPALAAGPSGPVSATGSGHFVRNGALRTFEFSARTSKDGAVTGMANLQSRSAGVFEHIAIDCLRVVDNVAYMSGVVINSKPSDIEGAQARFVVVDNGEGKEDSDVISLVETYGPGSPVNGLNAEDFPGGAFTLGGGNVQVRAG